MAKVFNVILCGFVFSLSTVSLSVLSLRKLQGGVVAAEPPSAKKIEKPKRRRRLKSAPPPPPGPPPKAFSDELTKILFIGSLVSLPLSIVAARTDFAYSTSLQTIAMLFATVTGYVWGARLPIGITKVVHPILTSAMIALMTTQFSSWAMGSSFEDTLRTYKVGSLLPTKTGAGDILLYALGPTVVSFSISMYGRKKLLKENLFIVIFSMLVSSIGGLFGTAAFVRAISVGSRVVRLSVLTRNVTTPLAIVITNMLGGNMAIAASMAIATSIIGATYGRAILTSMGVKDPVSRGLAIGAAGQGLGVASLVSEPDAFPFAAMSLVLNAIAATVIVCVPACKDALMKLALGTVDKAI